MKEKLESDRHDIYKFNEKVEEWKVRFNLLITVLLLYLYFLVLINY